MFWWAKFRKGKGGIKVHTLFDITTQIPAFIHLTTALVNDVNGMDQLVYEPEAYYIFDRGYTDFARLYTITQKKAFFVIRARSRLAYRRMYSAKADKDASVLCDQTGKLMNFYPLKSYPEKLRRIKYYDKESGKTFVFLTNNIEITALQVALLYRNRWQIELFFKWIKQHLKIKSFWGTSENAVRIQVYSAMIAYCLVAIVAAELKTGRSAYEILQVLGVSLLDKTPVNELLIKSDYQDVKELNCNQLLLSLF